MSRTLADLIAFAKQYFRSPVASFFTLVFPVLLLLIFVGVFGSSEEVEVEVHVQDLDGTAMSSAFVRSLQATGVLSVVNVSSDQDLAQYVSERSIPAALQIPAGFESEVQSALGGSPSADPTVILFGDPSNSAFQTVNGVVGAVVNAMNFDLQMAVEIIGVESRSISQGGFSALDFFLPGIIGISVITPIFLVSTISAEYRTRHYFKLMATTPLRKGEYLASRTIFVVALTFLSTFIMILVAWLAFGEIVILTPIAVGLIASGAVLFVAIGMAIGNMAKEPEAASALANVVYFPMMFLTGTFFPLEIMPSFLQVVALALPLTYFNNGLRDTLIFGNVPSALLNLAIVAILALIFFILAARSLNWRAD
ncbi:MAG: ABC transporter permease [Thermoplasmata archaeon]